MKRNVIAVLLSISLVAGSFGAAPLYAAEVTAQEAESEQDLASAPLEEESPAAEEETVADPSSENAEEQAMEEELAEEGEQNASSELEMSDEDSSEELDENGTAEGEVFSDEEDIEESGNMATDEEPGSAATDEDTETAAVVEPALESVDESKGMRAGEAGDVVASGYCGPSATWTLTGAENNLTLTISGRGEISDYSSSSRIPWYDNRDKIKNVVIEEGITLFHRYSFSHYSSIESVFLPNSLNSIPEYAFYGCTNLENITMPEQLNEIGVFAFGNCKKLTSIDIPNGVTRLSSTFSDCSALESVVVPEGVSELNGTFSDCIALSNVTLPDGLTDLGSNTFKGCSSLKSIVLPEGVTGTGYSTFLDCNSLESIELPDALVEIGGQSFYGCISLTSIDIPSRVTQIGYDAFFGCSALTSLIIPDGVTQIDNGAFAGCTGLEYIDMPDSLTEFGNQVFYNCENLTSIDIPNGVCEIGLNTFGGCKNLKDVVLPESVVSIGKYAFLQCNNLKSITFPEGVNTIGEGAFSGCSSLSNIFLPAGLTQINEHAFSGCTSLEEVEFPDDLVSIEDSAFYGCNSLTELVFPEGMKSIGSYAFRSCRNLTRITVPGSVTSIAETAFYDDSRIRECFTVPGSYISTHIPTYNSYNTNIVIKYLCDESPSEYHYIGFITDTICVEIGETISLDKYIVSDFIVSECLITLSNEDVFVYDDGMIASFGTGECDITVSNGDISSTVKVIAQDTPVSKADSIAFAESTITMVKGQTVTNTVTVAPFNSNIEGFVWASSDDSVVSVNDGKIVAVGAGEATISVTDPDNSDVYSECEVSVIVPLNNIIINEYSLRIEKGKSKKIKLYKYPSDSTDEISYSSTDSEIAEVSQGGIINAKNFGNTVITIHAGSITKEIEVQVFRPLSGISLDLNNTRLLAGETIQLNVKFDPEDTTETSVTWESSKESVATVDENGLVTAHGKGIARITATAGDFSAYCTIICPDVPMTGIEMAENQTIEYGKDYIPTITFIPSTTTDDKTTAWQSSDPGIFTVSEDGTVTPTGIGTATLTATVGEFSATSEITVVKGTPEYVTPEMVNGKCGQTLEELELPDGFEWENPEENVGNAGTNQHEVIYVPEDSEHYSTVGDIIVVVDVTHNFSEEWTQSPDLHWHECVCGERSDEDGHIFGDWMITVEPTCSELGEKETTCAECGYVEHETIDATGHDWYSDYTVDVEATCTESGEKSIYCKDCGEKKEGSTVDIPPLGHVYAEKVIQPTCSQGGFTMHICGRCGDYYEDNETQPTGHSFGDWIIDNDSTCTEEGIRHRECADCGYIETRGINKKEHSFDTEFTVDKEPTCTTDGSRSHHCTSEGCTATTGSEVIPATGHDYSDWTVTREATCTESGEMQRTCAVCDETEIVEYGARGHVWLKTHTVDQEATCTEEGSESIRCAVCDEVKEGSEQVIPAAGHALTHVEAVPATYENEGNIEYYRCEACGKIYSDESCEQELSEDETVLPKIDRIPVKIVTQPADVEAAADEQVTFSVVAEGSDLSYQWQLSSNGTSWSNCKGAGYDTDTFSFVMNKKYAGRRYRCIVTSGEETVTSDAAVLSYKENNKITGQPEDVNAAVDETVAFHVEATGKDLSYQWQYSVNGTYWGNCTGSSYNTDTFSFKMQERFDGRKYRCVVTADGNTLISNAAAVYLKQTGEIVEQPQDRTAGVGDEVSFYVGFSGNDPEYQWQYSLNGSYWSNCKGSSYDSDTFSFVMQEKFDGRRYRCVIRAGGMTYTSDSVTVRLAGNEMITSQPEDMILAAGGTASFHVGTSESGLTYQWQWSSDGKTWKNCTGAGYNNDTFRFVTQMRFSGRSYRCMVTDGTKTEYSDSGLLTVTK